MGLETVSKAISDDRLLLIGDKEVADKMQVWLGLNPFAVQEKQVSWSQMVCRQIKQLMPLNQLFIGTLPLLK